MTNTIQTGLGRIHLRAELIFGIPFFDVQISHLISGDSSCAGLRWPYFSLILFQATTVLLWESFGELIWF